MNQNRLHLKLLLFSGFLTLLSSGVMAQPQPQTVPSVDPAFIPEGNIVTSTTRVHDPVMIKDKDTYYIYTTGIGAIKSSDMKTWGWDGPRFSLFPEAPAWYKEDITDQRPGLWAPDISFRDGKFHMYYSVSAWMNFNSSIGYATNTTLDPADPAYKWVDHGRVISFRNGGEGVNVIDPNIFVDTDKKVWLFYGSYKSGLRIVELDPKTGKLFDEANPGVTLITDHLGEGVFVLKSTDGYYYIFASRGKCCAGIESTYEVVMGRSRNVRGPYLGKKGENWAKSEYSKFMTGDYSEPGRGHNGFYTEGKTTYILYHAYNREANGSSLLRISPLYIGADGWPTVQNTGKLFSRVQ